MSSANPLDTLYQDVLLDHSSDPRNFGEIPGSEVDLEAEGYNPLCGDRVSIQIHLKEDGITAGAIRFKGEGCSICMASASMMTEEMTGLKLSDIDRLIADFRGLMQGEVSPESFEGDLSALSGVRKFPVRIKCALLPWTTLKNALDRRAEREATHAS